MRSLAILLALTPACRRDGPGKDDQETVRDPRLVLGEVQACDDPLPEPSWTDVSDALFYPGQSWMDHEILNQGAGLGVADIDADGDYDILYGPMEDDNRLYRSNGDGTYDIEVWTEMPPAALSFHFADIDGDGHLDITTGNFGFPTVYLNDGAGNFTWFEDLPEWQGWYGTKELAPADYDGDGDIDLFAVMSTEHNGLQDTLLHNDTDGSGELSFRTDVMKSVDGSAGLAFDGIWFDHEDDGDFDMYVVNDIGSLFGPNYLLRNVDGALSQDLDCTCGFSQAAMGVDIADYNRDGLVDILTTDSNTFRLLQGYDGPEGFVEVSNGSGLWDPLGEMAWGGVFTDLDNDGYVDVVSAMGLIWSSIDDKPLPAFDAQGTGIWYQRGGADFTFSDASETTGFDQDGNYRAVVALDHNGDGVQDIVASDLLEGLRMYLSDGCTAAGWLEVAGPMGTKVEIEVGGATLTDWIVSDSSNGAGRPALVHFGLGDVETIDRLVATVPGPAVGRGLGEREVLEWTEAFPARRRVEIVVD